MHHVYSMQKLFREHKIWRWREERKHILNIKGGVFFGSGAISPKLRPKFQNWIFFRELIFWHIIMARVSKLFCWIGALQALAIFKNRRTVFEKKCFLWVWCFALKMMVNFHYFCITVRANERLESGEHF